MVALPPLLSRRSNGSAKVAEPGAAPAKPDTKGSLLKKKVAGIPAPVLLVVGGIAVYYLYSKRKASQGASTSSSATPTASSGTPVDSSGGYTSGSGGGYTNPNTNSANTVPTTSPTDTSSLTPAPPATVNQSNITPTGKRTITIGGKSYSTVSGFIQNGNQYLGINNPGEAKRLTAAGVHLVHNPNDPNGKAEFVLIPKGAKGPVVKKPAPKRKAPARG